MPNLLANEELYPEFLQEAATSENISRAALELLKNPARRDNIRRQLEQIISAFRGPGASQRAAHAIVELLRANSHVT